MVVDRGGLTTAPAAGAGRGRARFAAGEGEGGSAEAEPRTLPWPLNLPEEVEEEEEEEAKGLLTFFMKSLSLSLTSSMDPMLSEKQLERLNRPGLQLWGTNRPAPEKTQPQAAREVAGGKNGVVEEALGTPLVDLLEVDRLVSPKIFLFY